MSEQLVTAGLAGVVPSIIISLIGFLARGWLADIRGQIAELVRDVRDVRAHVGLQSTDLAVLRTRIEVLEREMAELKGRHVA